ncbi:MAG: hypothetical protein HZB43_00920 [candidate division Zixibacteria bacterium]|nr:hypothetical protein [candidate division Zixibacteria bacterium]
MKPLNRSSLVVLILLPASCAFAETTVHGIISMVGRNSNAADRSNRTIWDVSPFDPVYATLFFDASVSERLSAFLELYADGRYDRATLHGAYIRYDHTQQLHLEAGLIPTPVGLWPARAYADKNPLISTPAIYQYQTSLDVWDELQTSTGEVLEDRGNAEYAAPIFDFWWNTGVHGYASVGRASFGLALLNGSLSNPQRRIIYNQPNVAAHASLAFGPYVTVGGWGAIGPYLASSFGPSVPEGKKLTDYRQMTIGLNLHASAGHWDANAEGLLNRYEHPYFGLLDNAGAYADVKYTFAVRWWAASRIDMLGFSHLNADSANGQRWDYPITRFELGVGRWMSEHAALKLVAQFVRYSEAPLALNDEVYALQFIFKM